jgi:hypothetical protein
MLDAINQNQIIVGAYTDDKGGVCPMLAAHRNGGRTSLASFARAWDLYTGAAYAGARPATRRELRTLRAMLEASLWTDGPQPSLGSVVDEHLASQAGRAVREEHEPAEPERRDTDERDRTSELRDKPGWAWLRVFRRYDEYEAALDSATASNEQQEDRELTRV